MKLHIDKNLQNVEDKFLVIYTANKKGQMPNSFDKSVIPSSVPMNSRWYLGYTNKILEDFNMFKIYLSVMNESFTFYKTHRKFYLFIH